MSDPSREPVTVRPPGRRNGNKRGFGDLLYAEIIAAAERLLAASGPQETLTLRAIAREAGIAAPSIYLHFDNRDAILDVVIERAFAEMGAYCADAAGGTAPGPPRVEAICSAYLEFARDQPGKYRILFERTGPNIASPPHPYRHGLQAFDLLVRAIQDVVADPGEATLRAQCVFLALHGAAALPPALPGFPWAPTAALIRTVAGQSLTPC